MHPSDYRSASVRSNSVVGLPTVQDRVSFKQEPRKIQVLRAVIDVIQQCNLRCLYCHPGEVWRRQELPAAHLEQVLRASEDYGLLEVVLTGGEITLHPELSRILDATHLLSRTASTVVTNATRVDDHLVKRLADSNLTRICVSVDGLDAESHGSARGDNHARVLEGLAALQETGKPITVISVAHKANFRRLSELTQMLLESGLATQHHLVAPSYSGTAKENYPALKLDLPDFIELQAEVDANRLAVGDKDFIVTFNSYWPATGLRSSTDARRTLTLQQLTEQSKDTYVIVRPDGDFRLTVSAWGRETVGNHVIGHLGDGDATSLMRMADDEYFSGSRRQLTRAEEARHKFHVGRDRDTPTTEDLISVNTPVLSPNATVPLVPLSESDIMLHCDLLEADVAWISEEMRVDPDNLRIVEHRTGPVLVFDRRRSRIAVLESADVDRLQDLVSGSGS